MDERTAAAAENARWCDLVCRSHGLPTGSGADVWATARRAPRHHPDAVTTSPAATAEEVLAAVDAGPGCSVKDSFAGLDLSPWGFEVLFEARWVHRDAAPAPPGAGHGGSAVLRPVTDAAALGRWRTGHGDAGALTLRLLEEPSVVVLGDAGCSQGAVGHRAGAVVGVSNVFTGADGSDRADRVWWGVVRALTAWAPGAALVGYERPADLAPALRAGFRDVGPLRVWHRPG